MAEVLARHFPAISIEVEEPLLLQYDLCPAAGRMGAVDAVEPAAHLGLVKVDMVESAAQLGLAEGDRNVDLSGRSHAGLQEAVLVEVVGSVAALAEKGPRNGQEKIQPD